MIHSREMTSWEMLRLTWLTWIQTSKDLTRIRANSLQVSVQCCAQPLQWNIVDCNNLNHICQFSYCLPGESVMISWANTGASSVYTGELTSKIVYFIHVCAATACNFGWPDDPGLMHISVHVHFESQSGASGIAPRLARLTPISIDPGFKLWSCWALAVSLSSPHNFLVFLLQRNLCRSMK